MPRFRPPVWLPDATWSLRATLSRMAFGAFWEPLPGDPEGPKQFTDTKVVQDETSWIVRVVEAPDEPHVSGRVDLDLACMDDEDGSFHREAYRLELRREVREPEEPPAPDEDEDPEPVIQVGLASVRELGFGTGEHPVELEPEERAEAWPAGTPKRPVVEVDPGRGHFDPTEETGFLFDLPLLRTGLRPTVEPVEHGNGRRWSEERRSLEGGEGLEFVLAHAFPAGPTVRTVQRWLPGEPWYRSMRREMVMPLEEEEEQVEVQASVELEEVDAT